ncbi:MAG: hypothetical protein A2583_06660 [Bdellovibrionales bacterium RIFOXYD1_FULL_53_11]|nr:MAG: hypothetical protein A2583_06660 [Bdellovibrionales bacterium RIFOXYD1_FULL_53_11]
MTPKYAGFWIRLVADLIDSLLLSVAAWILEYALLGIFYGGWALYASKTGQDLPSFRNAFNALWMQVFNLGLYGVLAFPYYVWGQFKYGTTLGKKPLKIYVVSADDFGRITLKQSIIRCLGFIVSYLPFIAGYFMAGLHPRKQALHDLLAGTVSIRKKDVQTAAPAAV